MKRYERMTKDELYLSFLNSDYCQKEWCLLYTGDCSRCVKKYYEEEVDVKEINHDET